MTRMLTTKYRIEQLKRIYNFVINLKRAYHVFNRHIGIEARLDEIRNEFNRFDFDDGRRTNCNDVLGDPLTDAGTAIRLAQRYKIELHPGICYVDCRAVLNKENWEYPINGALIRRFEAYENPNNVDDIYGFGRTVNEAICQCLICAKTAKVI